MNVGKSLLLIFISVVSKNYQTTWFRLEILATSDNGLVSHKFYTFLKRTFSNVCYSFFESKIKVNKDNRCVAAIKCVNATPKPMFFRLNNESQSSKCTTASSLHFSLN